MALLFEEKEACVAIIDAIWSGSMNDNTVDNITEEIVDEIGIILSEIKKCSDNIHALFQ